MYKVNKYKLNLKKSQDQRCMIYIIFTNDDKDKYIKTHYILFSTRVTCILTLIYMYV